MTSIQQLKSYFQEHHKAIFKELIDFLSIPSISSDPNHKKDILACKDWVIEAVRKRGFQVDEWCVEGGHPTIFAQNLKAGPDKPTVLLYSHYDVQPVDPISDWKTPPFQPTIDGDLIIARGANDDKGQCLYILAAIDALQQIHGKLPVNVKLCIEGEEEMGSTTLFNLIPKKTSDLACDVLVVVDGGLKAQNIPTVELGMRGIITMDIEVEAANVDAHSGSYGGVIYNPNRALVEILSALRDVDGKVAIDGFYDDVIPLAEEEKKLISFDFDTDGFQAYFKTEPTGGEKGYTPWECAWIRPTIEINGISGGYAGQGFKTVIPSKAIAKVSCRLVPNQDPEKMKQLVKEKIEAMAPRGVRVKVHPHAGGGKAVRASPLSKANIAMAKAFSEVMGSKTQFNMTGGSVPVIASLADALKPDLVMMGLRLEEDKMHAANEQFSLSRFEQGFLVIAKHLELLGEK